MKVLKYMKKVLIFALKGLMAQYAYTVYEPKQVFLFYYISMCVFYGVYLVAIVSSVIKAFFVLILLDIILYAISIGIRRYNLIKLGNVSIYLVQVLSYIIMRYLSDICEPDMYETLQNFLLKHIMTKTAWWLMYVSFIMNAEEWRKPQRKKVCPTKYMISKGFIVTHYILTVFVSVFMIFISIKNCYDDMCSILEVDKRVHWLMHIHSLDSYHRVAPQLRQDGNFTAYKTSPDISIITSNVEYVKNMYNLNMHEKNDDKELPFCTHICRVSTNSLIQIDLPFHPSLIKQELEVVVNHITDLHHFGFKHTECLDCRTPLKNCVMTGTKETCRLTITLSHTNSYGDYEIIVFTYDRILNRGSRYCFTCRLRFLPEIDTEILEYIPAWFITESKKNAINLLQDEETLSTEENVQSLIHTLETEVEMVSLQTVKIIFVGSIAFVFLLSPKVAQKCHHFIEEFEESLCEIDKLYDVFVSYSESSKHDQEIVIDRLIPDLNVLGLNIRSNDDIYPGQQLHRAFFDEISMCKVILIVWSKDYEEENIHCDVVFYNVIFELVEKHITNKQDVFLLQLDGHPVPFGVRYLLQDKNIFSLDESKGDGLISLTASIRDSCKTTNPLKSFIYYFFSSNKKNQ